MNFHTRETPQFGEEKSLQSVPTRDVASDDNEGEKKILTSADMAQYKPAVSADTILPSQTLLKDELEYTVTITEAQALILEARRKPPSERSMQRYCNDENHVLRGMKVSTTTGQEFLINKTSLDKFIITLPLQLRVSNVSSVPTLGDAAVATTELKNENSEEGKSTVSADKVTTEETKNLREENSILKGELKGKQDLIDAQNLTMDFFKEEMRANREHRGEISGIAEKMLKTLETIASRGSDTEVLPPKHEEVTPVD
jgi:hypothetical protein